MEPLTFKYLLNKDKEIIKLETEKETDKELVKEDKTKIIQNKIEYIFYITLALLLLYEIINIISDRQNISKSLIINQKGGNPLGVLFQGISTAAKSIGKVAAKSVKIGAKVAYKTTKAVAKVASKIGSATSNIVSSVGSTVGSTVGAIGSVGSGSSNYGNDNNVTKKEVSKGIKSINTGISEKESYQELMQNQQSSKGKIFVFGIIICFFSFLLLSVLPIFSIIIILIISFAYAKDEFVKFIKSV